MSFLYVFVFTRLPPHGGERHNYMVRYRLVIKKIKMAPITRFDLRLSMHQPGGYSTGPHSALIELNKNLVFYLTTHSTRFFLTVKLHHMFWKDVIDPMYPVTRIEPKMAGNHYTNDLTSPRCESAH